MATDTRLTAGNGATGDVHRVPTRYRYDHDRGTDWAALERFAGVATAAGVAVSADEFMWMQAAEFADGHVVHAYKHVDTRRYLHLDGSGHAYRYTAGGGYMRWAEPTSAIADVFDVAPAGVAASSSQTDAARSILAGWTTPTPVPAMPPSVEMGLDL